MRAVGEALGLGRTFPEAFLKAMDGREAPPVSCPSCATRDRSSRAADRVRSAEPLRSLLLETGDVAAAKRFDLPDPPVLRATRSEIAEREVARAAGSPARLAVDSCAGEFEARTPYYYLSARGRADEGPSRPAAR